MPTDQDLVAKLSQRIETSRHVMEKMDRYYSGKQALAYLSPEVKAAAGTLFNVAVNWPRLVVGSVEERIDVEGFRLAEEQPDADLWRIWQSNDLDEQSQMAHAEALVHGRSYVIAWAGPDRNTPRISIESAKQTYVLTDPGSGARLAAVKRFTDAEGFARATLFLPNRIVRYKSTSKAPAVDYDETFYDAPVSAPPGGWSTIEEIRNPLGVVPVVPLVNRPRLLNPDGESELADIIPMADAINKLATDLMVSAEFHAQPRRWATGFDIPMIEDPENEGEEIPDPDAFSGVKGRVWIAEGDSTKFGQFNEAELTGFVRAIEMFERQVAALSALPPHYLNINVDNPQSADAIRSSEASLVSKARRKMRSFGGSWEEVMRIALLVKNGTLPAGAERIEVQWADPETRTVAQAADAATKLVTANIIPADQALEDLGYTPTQIDRIREMRRRSSLDTINPEDLLP